MRTTEQMTDSERVEWLRTHNANTGTPLTQTAELLDLREENITLRAQRDELAEALKATLELFESYVDTESVVNADIVETVRNARALLARLEGGGK